MRQRTHPLRVSFPSYDHVAHTPTARRRFHIENQLTTKHTKGHEKEARSNLLGEFWIGAECFFVDFVCFVGLDSPEILHQHQVAAVVVSLGIQKAAPVGRDRQAMPDPPFDRSNRSNRAGRQVFEPDVRNALLVQS